MSDCLLSRYIPHEINSQVMPIVDFVLLLYRVKRVSTKDARAFEITFSICIYISLFIAQFNNNIISNYKIIS